MKRKGAPVTKAFEGKIRYVLQDSRNPLTKKQVMQFTHTTEKQLDRLVKELDAKGFSYTEELEEMYTRAKKLIHITSRNKESNEHIKIEKYKRLKFLTNRELVEIAAKQGNRLTVSQISSISTGKTKPSVKTQFIIADALREPVYEVFPDNWFVRDCITCYNDYVRVLTFIRTSLQYIDMTTMSQSAHVSKSVINNILYMKGKTVEIDRESLDRLIKTADRILNNKRIEIAMQKRMIKEIEDEG